ncbi:N-acetyltransferase family protein [Tundrisphaera sp. TA3]|uniref:GNAT family N-acetyltransferase n=1 Tax=Tundrisphaera sp. TA3 TaxID=3435775 RepID=UPI003EC08879
MDKPAITLRETLKAGDRGPIAAILEGSGAFRSEEIAIGLELVDETLNPGPSTDYRWVMAEANGRVIGFACFGPVPLTEGTYDLYWIAVDAGSLRSGAATRLDEAAEAAVRASGARWLLAETSSTEIYAPARAFYLRRGYQLLERIADFYRPGDDRLTFGKRLDRG